MDPAHELNCGELADLYADLMKNSNHVDGSFWVIGAENPYTIGPESREKIDNFVSPDVLLNEIAF